MSFTLRIWFCFLALSLNVISPALAQSQSAPSALVTKHPADEAALRALAEAFFHVWAAKDLDGFLRLWSAKSTELEARRKDAQELFAVSEKIELRNMAIRAVKAEDANARVRVEVDVRVIEAKTGKEKAGYGKMLRTLECEKVAGQWKVRSEASTYDEIGAALIAVKSDQERAALLAEERELVTAELAGALINQGNRFFEQGDYSRALTTHRQAQGMAERLGDKAGIARAQNSIGNVHRAQGDYALASDYFQKSLALSEALGDQVGVANTLRNIGNIQYSQGDYAQALESFRRGLELSQKFEHKAGIARSLGSLGLVYDTQGDYAKALEYYGKSLKQFEAIDDKPGIARTLGNIGIVHHELGNFAESLNSHRQSLTLFEEKSDKAGSARTLYNLGNVYLSQGSYAQALEYFQKSLIPREAMGDKPGITKTLAGIGFVHLHQSNYTQALRYFQQSRAMNEAMGDKAGIAEGLTNIGMVHDLQGDYAQALRHFQQSLEMKEALGDKAGIAYTLNSIGIVHRRQGDYAQSSERFQKSLEIKDALGDKAGIGVALYNLGSVHYRQGNYARALDFAERAATIARSIGANSLLWETLAMAGRACQQLNKPVEAGQALAEAITIIETLRPQVAGGEEERQRSFTSKVAPYHAMVDLFTREGKLAEALTFAERAKARVLLDVLQTGRVNIAKALNDQEQEQERRLRAELISLNTQVTRASQQNRTDRARLEEMKALRENARINYEAFQTSLYARRPELRAQRGEAPAIRVEEITALLPDAGSALLEYVVTDEMTYLFAITKATGAQVYTLPIKREELTKQTESFRGQLAGRDLGFRASARKLYDLLLKPAEVLLRGKSSLVISPDDKLWELPFQALLSQDGRYVIERSAVSYVPSLTVLREMRAKRNRRLVETAGYGLLALGNPAIGRETIERAALALRDEKLDPLPEAEQEVEALGRLYGRAQSKVYIGVEAREDRLKAEAAQARVLHFATHGISNNASPMYSHLVLAQGNENEDGLLEAWELMQLDLKADLAVLSACETARGRFGAGEGVIGLSWALFVAGVPATVVSQWKVESASTRELMVAFHRQLRPGAAQTTKAAALRQAALSVLKKPATKHPFYWAGFVLVGDNR